MFKPDIQDIFVFIFFFLLAIFLPMKYALILLGAALIVLAPFLVLERFSIPLIRKYQKLSVVLAFLSAFSGGMVWFYVFSNFTFFG